MKRFSSLQSPLGVAVMAVVAPFLFGATMAQSTDGSDGLTVFAHHQHVEFFGGCFDHRSKSLLHCALDPSYCYEESQFVTGKDLQSMNAELMKLHGGVQGRSNPNENDNNNNNNNVPQYPVCTPESMPIGRCAFKGDTLDDNQCSFGSAHCQHSTAFLSYEEGNLETECRVDLEVGTAIPTLYGACRNIQTNQVVCSLYLKDCIHGLEEWVPMSPECECHNVRVGLCDSKRTNQKDVSCNINEESCGRDEEWVSAKDLRTTFKSQYYNMDCRLCPPRREDVHVSKDTNIILHPNGHGPLGSSLAGNGNNDGDVAPGSSSSNSSVWWTVTITTTVLVFVGLAIMTMWRRISYRQQIYRIRTGTPDETIEFPADSEFVELSLSGHNENKETLQEADAIVQHQQSWDGSVRNLARKTSGVGEDTVNWESNSVHSTNRAGSGVVGAGPPVGGGAGTSASGLVGGGATTSIGVTTLGVSGGPTASIGVGVVVEPLEEKGAKDVAAWDRSMRSARSAARRARAAAAFGSEDVDWESSVRSLRSTRRGRGRDRDEMAWERSVRSIKRTGIYPDEEVGEEDEQPAVHPAGYGRFV